MTRVPTLAVLLALAAGASVLSQPDFRLAPDEYPVVDGSTSAQPLGTLIAGRVTRTTISWRRTSLFEPTRGLRLTSAPYDESKKLVLNAAADEPVGPDLNAELGAIGVLAQRTMHSGTSESYARLAANEAALVIVAREPTPDERNAVRRTRSDIVVHRIARDAFVFLRNSKNPVTGLTVEQIRDIYSGKITNWKEVGGADRAIHAYQRDATSGSQVEMEQLVMRGRPMPGGPDVRMTTSMFGPFNAIRSDTDGIGYSYHYYERYMAAVPEIATLAINGIAPDPVTIAGERYPLVTFVYLAHRADLRVDSAAARLRDWILTPAGQAVVAESGYVPLRGK